MPGIKGTTGLLSIKEKPASLIPKGGENKKGV